MGAMAVFLLSLGVIAAVMLAMAVGLLFNQTCLRGSCGGSELTGPDGDSLRCAACPKRRTVS